MTFDIRLTEYEKDQLILTVMTYESDYRCDTLLDNDRLQALGVEYLLDVINISKNQIKSKIDNDPKTEA